jgi:hypothetical protein
VKSNRTTNGKYAPAMAVPRRHVREPLAPHGEYSDEEREFLIAMDAFKRENRKPFPTWQEVFHVLLSLGYRKG